ncbi:hypothetical protein F4778DRAFT_717414 [Xylariomycetidae sp. FL2044]|nr:hypothetical protein F4778DRAFT_717414 [Xylariomycetidae sp. FL2044]
MTTQTEPEIVLYDLACTKNVCFSPVVWRIRIMLNYKKVSYRTVFLEFPDIEQTLKGLGIAPAESCAGSGIKYTVPAIHHVPTNTYIMESAAIAQFLETIYPDPPVPLTSDLGGRIQAETRSAIGPAFGASIVPRELGVLSPRAQEYFRRTREARLGHPLEDLLRPEREDRAWKAADEKLRAIDELLRTNADKGPFVLGAQPSYVDFYIAGNLQTAMVVDESLFERLAVYPGFKGVYEACRAYMEKMD